MALKRVTFEELVIERLKAAPLTQEAVPQMRLDCTVYRLRRKGWPVICELREYFNASGETEVRPEYRLGNWAAMALPMQTAPVQQGATT